MHTVPSDSVHAAVNKLRVRMTPPGKSRFLDPSFGANFNQAAIGEQMRPSCRRCTMAASHFASGSPKRWFPLWPSLHPNDQWLCSIQHPIRLLPSSWRNEAALDG